VTAACVAVVCDLLVRVDVTRVVTKINAIEPRAMMVAISPASALRFVELRRGKPDCRSDFLDIIIIIQYNTSLVKVNNKWKSPITKFQETNKFQLPKNS